MTNKHVTILMAVKDGARFLPEQLCSLANQKHRNWTLIASDDGSADNSKQILLEFASNERSVRVVDGPGKGHAENTLFLISAANGFMANEGWLALCDQDDVWLSDRLSRGIDQIGDTDQPALYCSRTIIADARLNNRRVSRSFQKSPSFQNALVQNIAPGNTILLNPAAAKLVCEAALEIEREVLPDWWIYQLITGAGGNVVHDPVPTLIYRQHGNNQFGENLSLMASIKRLGMILRGDFRNWIDQNISALKNSAARLDATNQHKLEEFADWRSQGLLNRLWRFRRFGFYRQSRRGTVALWFATALNRM